MITTGSSHLGACRNISESHGGAGLASRLIIEWTADV
jgi:hypothetical protein